MKGSCEINAPEIRDITPQDEDTKLKEEAAAIGVTPEKLKAMRHYARQLHNADRKMKESTIRSKVAKKFNLKLS